MKPHGDAVLSPKKVYFNYRLSRVRMITECAFGKLKGRFKVLFLKCESKMETVKIIGLACDVLHNLFIDKEDTRKFNLSYDHVTNNGRDRTEVRDMLNLTNLRFKDYDTGKGKGVKVREAIKKLFGMKKVGIHIYITFRKHFRKSFTCKFFHRFYCTLGEGIFVIRKFDGVDGCGGNPPN